MAPVKPKIAIPKMKNRRIIEKRPILTLGASETAAKLISAKTKAPKTIPRNAIPPADPTTKPINRPMIAE